MRSLLRSSTCAFLFACSAAGAQQPNAAVSGEWMPMTVENERLFQQAEAGFNIAVEKAKQQADEAQRGGRRPSRKELDAAGVPTATPSSSDGPLTEGGMSGPIGPGSGNPGRRTKNQARWLTLPELLPATLDFAAPPKAGLILQRTSTSVLFGRTDSDEMVMLPLSGAETDLAHGLRASIHEVNGRLQMLVGLPTGTQVLYEYYQDPDPAKHVLSVDIRVGGGPPGTGVELKRLYRQARVKVGAPRKSE